MVQVTLCCSTSNGRKVPLRRLTLAKLIRQAAHNLAGTLVHCRGTVHTEASSDIMHMTNASSYANHHKAGLDIKDICSRLTHYTLQQAAHICSRTASSNLSKPAMLHIATGLPCRCPKLSPRTGLPSYLACKPASNQLCTNGLLMSQLITTGQALCTGMGCGTKPWMLKRR